MKSEKEASLLRQRLRRARMAKAVTVAEAMVTEEGERKPHQFSILDSLFSKKKKKAKAITVAEVMVTEEGE